MRRFASLVFAAAAGTIVPAAGVNAQIVDYSALGDMFGEPITTSVTGKPQRQSDAPASITIITRDEIARSPARTVPDLLKAYAGVDVNRWTAGQSDVAVRGGVQTYNARLLVLVDGRQVYLDHYGMTNWNLLGVQLSDIQQIEFVRGPASALFGFNAASGVVNIITTAPGAELHGSVTAEVGTRGYANIGGSITTPVSPSIGFKLTAGHRKENERRIPDVLYQPPRSPDVYADQINATITVQADTSTSIEINGGWAGNRQLEFLPSQILTEQRFRSQTAGLQITHDTDWGSITARTFTNWLQADYGITTPANDPYNAVADLRTDNRISVVTGSALVRLGAADTLRVGLEYRNNQLDSGSLFSRRIGYEVGAASAMLDVHPLDHVSLTGAIRVDHLWLDQEGSPVAPQLDTISAFNRSITPVSFNAGAIVEIGGNGRFRLNGGRGIQLPSLIDLGVRVLIPAPDIPLPVYLTGDPSLAPVKVWSAEANYSHDVSLGLQLGLTAFYTRTSNLIASPGGSVDVKVVLTPAPMAVTRFANVGAFESYGVELSASGKIASTFGWSANYSLVHVEEAIPRNRDAAYYALFPKAATPRHRANLGVDYAAAGWSANALAHLTTSSRQSSFVSSTDLVMVRVPTAISVDVRLGRAITPALSIYAAGENVTNARGAYGSPIPADRRVRVGLTARL